MFILIQSFSPTDINYVMVLLPTSLLHICTLLVQSLFKPKDFVSLSPSKIPQYLALIALQCPKKFVKPLIHMPFIHINTSTPCYDARLASTICIKFKHVGLGRLLSYYTPCLSSSINFNGLLHRILIV